MLNRNRLDTLPTDTETIKMLTGTVQVPLPFI